jgi:hypothetical protein
MLAMRSKREKFYCSDLLLRYEQATRPMEKRPGPRVPSKVLSDWLPVFINSRPNARVEDEKPVPFRFHEAQREEWVKKLGGPRKVGAACATLHAKARIRVEALSALYVLAPDVDSKISGGTSRVFTRDRIKERRLLDQAVSALEKLREVGIPAATLSSVAEHLYPLIWKHMLTYTAFGQGSASVKSALRAHLLSCGLTPPQIAILEVAWVANVIECNPSHQRLDRNVVVEYRTARREIKDIRPRPFPFQDDSEITRFVAAWAGR